MTEYTLAYRKTVFVACLNAYFQKLFFEGFMLGVSKIGHKPLLVILLAQAFLIPILVGVDVPYRDEWDSIIRALVLRASVGFHWNQLLLPVVEHRLPLPMTLFQALSVPRYYPKLFMVLSALTHLVGWYFFTKAWLMEAEAKINPEKKIILLTLVALMFFHWAQLINYTMGVQLFWVLGPVGTVVFIYGLIRKNFLYAILGHVVSILSFPSWPIHFGLFGTYCAWSICKKRFFPVHKFSWGLILTLFLSGALTFGFLYQHAGPGNQVSIPRLLKFSIFVISSGFSRYDQILGWIFGPLFIVIWSYRVISGPRYVSEVAYYLFGVLTLLSSLLIAYGRHLYDFNYAFSGHYLLLTIPGWCVVVYEWLSSIKSKTSFRVISTALVLYVAIMSLKSMDEELRKRRPKLLSARDCIAEKRETSAECLVPIRDLFLNGYEEKFKLMEKSRIFGVFP